MVQDKQAAQAWMDVDLVALQGNFHEIRRRVGTERKIIAVIKADACGFGAVEAFSLSSRRGRWEVTIKRSRFHIALSSISFNVAA